jgi:hypothetical protein
MPARRADRALRARCRLADRTAGLAQEVAGLVVATVVVHLALHADAGHQRVALQAHRAHAARSVEIHTAFRAAAARGRGGQAGVDTVLLDASLVQRTVGVGPTLGAVALAVGVAAVAFRTRADRVVGAGVALGLRRAGVLHKAGVDAALV